MRPRPLAAILLTLAPSTVACQLVWGYDDFKDQPGTGGSAGSSSSLGGGSTGGGSAGGGSTMTWKEPLWRGCSDHDKDGVLSWTRDPDDLALDCADEDDHAHPGADFASTPIVGARRPGTADWDLDCDGTITQKWHPVSCSFLNLNAVGYAPGDDPACGETSTLGYCAPTLWPPFGYWAAIVAQPQECK